MSAKFWITINDEARAAMMASSERAGRFLRTEAMEHTPAGWCFAVHQDTLERLLAEILPGESMSDLIIRLCFENSGSKPN